MSKQVTKVPFDFRPLDPDEAAILKENFDVYFEFNRIGPKGYIYSDVYEADAEKIYNLSLNSDDVVVASFPRSGTTWTQELVWLVANDLDYETARTKFLTERYTFIEFPSIFTRKAVEDIVTFNEDVASQEYFDHILEFSKPGSEVLASRPLPRYIKTHMPLSVLPPSAVDTARLVYVARDPRDVAVSFYHQCKLFKYQHFTGDFKIFWDLFTKNLLLWCPFFDHLKEAWAIRHQPNVLFLFYEELSKDLPAAVRRVADFFNKTISEEQVARLCEHLSFDNFKNNEAVNFSPLKNLGLLHPDQSFIRKGKCGGWRDYFDAEMSLQAERWIADNLRDTDLRFPHLSELSSN